MKGNGPKQIPEGQTYDFITILKVVMGFLQVFYVPILYSSWFRRLKGEDATIFT